MCKDFVFVFYFSYKLWYNYLKLRRRQVKGRCLNDPAIEDVINAHERALVFMHKVIVDSKEKQKQNQYNVKFYIFLLFVLFRCLEFGLTTVSFW